MNLANYKRMRLRNTVDFMQTNQIDVKIIDVVCKIIDEVSFAGTDSVMHGKIEKMAEH